MQHFIAIIAAIASVVGAYMSSSAAITDKINTASATITSEISQDRERIATVEEAVKTIKTSQTRTEDKIDKIYQILK